MKHSIVFYESKLIVIENVVIAEMLIKLLLTNNCRKNKKFGYDRTMNNVQIPGTGEL